MFIFNYRCPATGYRVEGQSSPVAEGPLTAYVAERCPACAGVHIVNPLTGRLIADELARPPLGMAATAPSVPALA